MAWTTIASTLVDADSPITETLMGYIKDDLDYLKGLFNTATGHDHSGDTDDGGTISALEIADGSVSQAKLKTTTGEVSYSNGNINTDGTYAAISGVAPDGDGTYGTVNTYATHISLGGKHFETGNSTAYYVGGSATLSGGTYSFYPQIKSSSDQSTKYAQNRYVQASGKDWWIFLLWDHLKKNIMSTWIAQDHPAYGQGVREDKLIHPFLGVTYSFPHLTIGPNPQDPEKSRIIKERDDIVKRFYKSDWTPQLPPEYEVFLIHWKPCMDDILAERTQDRCITEIIREKFEIDFNSRPKYEPQEIIEIDRFNNLEGEVVYELKEKDTSTDKRVFAKRRYVEQLPSIITYRELKSKTKINPVP